MDMPSTRRAELLVTGERLLEQVIADLNSMDVRPPHEYRRESDLEEICIALALYQEKVNNGHT